MESFFESDPDFDAKTIAQLVDIVEHGYTPNRARAISALGRKGSKDPSVQEKVLELVSSPVLRGARFMGTISLAHIGVLSIIAGHGGMIPSVVATLYTDWPEPDRSDLVWFLRSQEVDVTPLTGG